jgi:hypothetical protein
MQVVFLPRVSLRDYIQLYRAADAFVLATHGEGWGRPLMEAMAMGLPAIATAWCVLAAARSCCGLNSISAPLLVCVYRYMYIYIYIYIIYIYTPYLPRSGQQEFMTDRTSFLIPPSGLEAAFADAPQIIGYETGHQWARLDPARFGKAMRYVVEHRSMAGGFFSAIQFLIIILLLFYCYFESLYNYFYYAPLWPIILTKDGMFLRVIPLHDLRG